ncbi:TerD family protein [Actinomadura macrotermitis]|uniref:TerD family protein n=1 Tax=Actinomadura macrotermitis TaxID=2585200 RepID=UPI001A9B9073|nr:TerD family protein [Actinomadura macrotermitis]
MERARWQAERAQQEAERDAAIARLNELRRQTTSVHLTMFPPARPPQVPPPPQLGLPWALAEARAFHLHGVGRFARAERAGAGRAAEQDAHLYLAAEQARLGHEHQRLAAEARNWWEALNANDEQTVCEAVNTAFADNPAAGCAVGVDGGVLSVVVRLPDLDSLPEQMPGLTPAGRPTLKRLTKRDRTRWWLTVMGSNVIATLKEAFATAPAITAIDLAVLTRIPATGRLGFVAYGRWDRAAIESRRWRTAEDALRFLDIGQDVVCSVTTASGNPAGMIKPLDTDRLPGLQALLDNSTDEAGLDESLSMGQDVPARAEPYPVRSFAQWKQEAGAAPLPPFQSAPPMTLAPGQAVVLPEGALQGLLAAFSFSGADADLTLLLTGSNGQVAGDDDFVFYNQPFALQGAARLLGKRSEGMCSTERAALHLSALPDRVQRVIVSINMDVDTGRTCGALTHAVLRLQGVDGTSWEFRPPADPAIRAMVMAELYRHTLDGRPVWKLRALGQGWADGLDGLARSHGVHID